ncbi:tRNA (uridine(54)-C5)-methyltransferase TrmA [Aurantivibrio plasticivorans]
MIAVAPNPADYDKQFAQKQDKVRELLAPFLPNSQSDEIEAFASPALHFRMRAEFKIWHQDDRSHYAVYDQGAGNPPTCIDTFPIAGLAINKLMPDLIKAIERNPLLRQRLFQVEFLSTLAGDMLVTLVYHKPLTDEWEADARNLSEQLSINIIGRSRKQKRVLDKDFVNETFDINGQPFHYKQLEGCFSQPNGPVCEKMLYWASDCVLNSPISQDKQSDMLELYCGNGNFTLPLSRAFKQVLGTEISKPLTAAATENCQRNEIDNITFARMSAEDMSAAIAGVRPFRRLSHVNLADYQFSTIFVDPPRAGLDDATVELVKGFEQILYISCNPNTLADNLKELTKTHQIERAAFFDQFPYTDHMEAGVLLSRR